MTNPTNTPRDVSAIDQEQEAAELYVEQLLAFRVHAAVFGVGMILIFAVNLLTNLAANIGNEWSAWWSLWALIGWGLGISIHGLVVRLNRPALTTSSWKQQQIDKLLDR